MEPKVTAGHIKTLTFVWLDREIAKTQQRRGLYLPPKNLTYLAVT